MTRFGLDRFLESFPSKLRGKQLGVVCHAASIASTYGHIVDVLAKVDSCELGAIFGPQHGLYGQTQDNMIEWQGYRHPTLDIPVYSLYGETRKPTLTMLEGLDALVVDLQDVGARPYTYVWTIKLCMEACSDAGLPLWILDRPNPIGAVPLSGPVLNMDFASFVGGAEIPLCHRMTMGELAVLLKNTYFPSLDLEVVWMKDWWRDSLWSETGLPWVMPSPNMPTLDSAIVYPGMVLLEATNVSEGRGTTRPFELFGAPYIDKELFEKDLFSRRISGCTFREHGFIPTFQKWAGEFCQGWQIHVTNPRCYDTVGSTAWILNATREASNRAFSFKRPPYEYEHDKMPFDILSGDTTLRDTLEAGEDLAPLMEQWAQSHEKFQEVLAGVAHYDERPS